MCCPRRSFLEGVGLLKGGTRVVPTRWQKGGAAVVLSASCRDVVAIVFGDTVRRRNACGNEEGNRHAGGRVAMRFGNTRVSQAPTCFSLFVSPVGPALWDV